MDNIKKYKIAIISVSIIILLVTAGMFLINRDTDQVFLFPTPTPFSQTPVYISSNNFGEINLRDSKKLSVIESALNNPVDQQGNIRYFVTDKELVPSEGTYDQDKLVLFKQMVEDNSEQKTLIDIQNNFGFPEVILYGQDAENGTYLFGYPSLGFAFIAHEPTSKIYEFWYFENTDQGDFLNNLANGYYATMEESEEHHDHPPF